MPVDDGVGLRAKVRLELLEEFRGPRCGAQGRFSAGIRSQVRVDVAKVKRAQGLGPGNPRGLDSCLNNLALDSPHLSHRADHLVRSRLLSVGPPAAVSPHAGFTSTSQPDELICFISILVEDMADLRVDRLGRELIQHDPWENVLHDQAPRRRSRSLRRATTSARPRGWTFRGKMESAMKQ